MVSWDIACRMAALYAQAYADMVSKPLRDKLANLFADANALIKQRDERISELELNLAEEKRRSEALLKLGAGAELRTK